MSDEKNLTDATAITTLREDADSRIEQMGADAWNRCSAVVLSVSDC